MQESEISKIDWFKNHNVESHKERQLQMHPQASTVPNFPANPNPFQAVAKNQCKIHVYDGPLQKSAHIFI